jgi:hypothetical protein
MNIGETKTQINKIRNKNEETATNTKKIQETIRNSRENLYSIKFKYLEEMGKFQDTHDQTKFNQEDINYLNRSKTQNEIEIAIKNLPKKEGPRTREILH